MRLPISGDRDVDLAVICPTCKFCDGNYQKCFRTKYVAATNFRSFSARGDLHLTSRELTG